MRKAALLKVNKQYRIMKAFTLPYDKYYKAQIEKEMSIFQCKLKDALNVYTIEVAANSNKNLKINHKKKVHFVNSFNEYMKQKNLINKRRKELENGKSHLVLAKAMVEKKRQLMISEMKCGKFTSVQNMIDWIPRYTEQLHNVQNKQCRVFTKACLQRRAVASDLQQRLLLKEQMLKAQSHLYEGKLYFNDIVYQALNSFKEREDSLHNSFRAKQYREAIVEKGRKSLQVLQIRYATMINLVQFYTIKNQTRVMSNPEEEINAFDQMIEKENSLTQYLNDTLPFISRVFTFFGTTDLNEITMLLDTNWKEIFHIASLNLHVGAEGANNGYKVIMAGERMFEHKRIAGKKAMEANEKLAQLKREVDYLYAIKNLYRVRLTKLEEVKQYYMKLLDKMLKHLPIERLLRKLKRWDTLDTMVTALECVERLGVKALHFYQMNHPEYYYQPYKRDQHGKWTVHMPKDVRLKRKAYNILLEHKRLVDVFKTPKAPCFLCIQEERKIYHTHNQDLIRSRKSCEDTVKMRMMYWNNMSCLHKIDSCPTSKLIEMAKELDD
ncbi:uncharacterized protein LOC106668173 isoform X2 [Cimex lectularius]|nr:uncharacterized protein LOC106668173 isoform X2 [Cimex lectularius]